MRRMPRQDVERDHDSHRSASSAERAKRHRVAQLADRRDVMFVRLSATPRHQIRRSPRRARSRGSPIAGTTLSLDAGERYGRNFIRHADSSEMPATMSYCGASRCQPIGEPGRYSLMSAMANASASTPPTAQSWRAAATGTLEAAPLPPGCTIGRRTRLAAARRRRAFRNPQTQPRRWPRAVPLIRSVMKFSR